MGPIILISFGLHILFGEMIDSLLSTIYLPALIIYWWILSCAVVEKYNKIKGDKNKTISQKRGRIVYIITIMIVIPNILL